MKLLSNKTQQAFELHQEESKCCDKDAEVNMRIEQNNTALRQRSRDSIKRSIIRNESKRVGKMVGYNKVVKSVREFKSYHHELKGDANVFARYKNYRDQHRCHEY